jgi:hypothetical protein
MNTQEYINYLCKISNKLKKGGCVGDSKGVWKCVLGTFKDLYW